MNLLIDFIIGLLIYAGALASYIAVVFWTIERRY